MGRTLTLNAEDTDNLIVFDIDDATNENTLPISCIYTEGNYTTAKNNVNSYISRISGFKDSIMRVDSWSTGEPLNFDSSSSQDHIDIDSFLKKLEGPKKLQYELAASCSVERKQVDLKGLNAEKQSMEESKLRLDGIRNSDTQVSYYEGWFPLFRPMSETSLFTVFSISIALLLVSIVAFLRMQGIELQILTPVSNFDFMATLRGYSSYIWAAIAVGLGIAFTATKMNWV